MTKKYFIGIDEVGRGPLAGPVTVCALACRTRNPENFAGIKDSKKLSPKKRGEWLKKMLEAKERGELFFAVASSDNKTIDKIKMTKAISLAVTNAMRELALCLGEDFSGGCALVLLDGGLHAPDEYTNQETIIRGDEKEPLIAMASIVAKEDRDGLMRELAKKYPKYGFEIHKGYGTKAHYEALKKCGPCEIHRRLFLHLT